MSRNSGELVMEWGRGDLIEEAKKVHGCHIAFTANAYLNRDEKLVMGRGAALRLKKALPAIDAFLGWRLYSGWDTRPGSVGPDYNLLAVDYMRERFLAGHVPVPPDLRWMMGQNRHVVAVQVKRHYHDQRDPASKEACFALAEQSFNELREWSREHGPTVVNCPLIGNGDFSTPQEIARVRAMVERQLRGAPVLVLTL